MVSVGMMQTPGVHKKHNTLETVNIRSTVLNNTMVLLKAASLLNQPHCCVLYYQYICFHSLCLWCTAVEWFKLWLRYCKPWRWYDVKRHTDSRGHMCHIWLQRTVHNIFNGGFSPHVKYVNLSLLSSPGWWRFSQEHETSGQWVRQRRVVLDICLF